MDPPTAEDKKKCDICYCICCKKIFPQRFFLELMLIFCTTIMYSHRVCISMAIVHMSNWVDNTTVEVVCTKDRAGGTAKIIEIHDQQFNWDESVQSYILLSFYIGYVIGNTFIGFLIDKFGGRWCLLIGSLMSSIMTLIAPLLAYNLHWGFLCASRAIAGLGQTPLTSCSSILISRWFLEDKKSGALTVVLTTYTVGVIVGNFFSGYIMEWTQAWCHVFYVFGTAGVLWVVLFYFYGYSYPQAHPHITEKELKELDAIPKPADMPIPIWRILSDTAVWMFFLGFMASDYTMYLIITNMPKYFVSVLGLGTSITGTILMGPPAAGALGGVVFGFISDWIIGKKIMKRLTFRMICTVIGLPISSLCMLIMVYTECNVVIASVLVCLSMFLKSAFYAGAGAMAVDLSINYGGLLYGYCNVAGGLSGMIAPYIVGALAYQNTFPQWKLVQFVTVAVATVILIPILMFSKADRKEWDYGPSEEKPPVDETPAAKRIWSCYKPV